jgi:CBS domain-containing protein
LERAEEFVQLFNKIQDVLLSIAQRPPNTPFWRLVDVASTTNAAVHSNSSQLKQFAMLRNAIVHDTRYPPEIVAIPSEEALERFKKIAQQILEPKLLIPTFAADVRCFSPTEVLTDALRFMREHDFSQIVVRVNDGSLRLLTVEGITKWVAEQGDVDRAPLREATLSRVLGCEHVSCFIVMGPNCNVFDADYAFRHSIHRDLTRLYAIIITHDGTVHGLPIGFVTPWDLVHNPRLREDFADS